MGYLADDIPNIRMLLGILSSITGDTVPLRWGYTEQRAFDDMKISYMLLVIIVECQ